MRIGRPALALIALLAALWLVDSSVAFAQHDDEHGDAPAESAAHGDETHAAETQADDPHADETHGETTGDHGEAAAHGEDHGDEGHHGEHGEHIELPHLIMVLRGLLGVVPHADQERAAEAGGYLSGNFGLGDVVHVFENTFFALLAALFLTFVSVRVYNNRQELPGRLQALVEIIVEQVDNICTTIMGSYGRHYAPFVGTIFVYLLCMNYSGLIPLGKASTSTFLNNISVALCVFLYVQWTGIRRNGIGGWLHHLCGSPKDVVGWALAPLMLFLEVFGELIKPISLSLRLFGNIFGEDMLLAIFALLGVILLAPLGSPIGIPLHLPFLLLSMLLGFIQAMVFALLSAVYLSMMLPHDEHH